LYPWEIRGATLPVYGSPELRKTQDLIKLYTSDIRAAKLSILNTHCRPEFPDSKWDSVLRGKAIDLNKVISNLSLPQVGQEIENGEQAGKLMNLHICATCKESGHHAKNCDRRKND
jgi:hypothetical protein